MDKRVALSCARDLGGMELPSSPAGARSGMLMHGVRGQRGWREAIVARVSARGTFEHSTRALLCFFACGLEGDGAEHRRGPGHAIWDSDARDVAACTVTEGAHQVHGAPCTRAWQVLACTGWGELRSPCSLACGALTWPALMVPKVRAPPTADNFTPARGVSCQSAIDKISLHDVQKSVYDVPCPCFAAVA